MSTKKKGIPVPLNAFLQPDTKITSWAEDEDFDADSKFLCPSSLLLPDTGWQSLYDYQSLTMRYRAKDLRSA